MAEDGGGARVNLAWDDNDVLPPVLSPDTEFVFRRMTEETLRATETRTSKRVLAWHLA